MKYFYLITNKEKDPDLTISHSIQRAFESEGCICKMGIFEKRVPGTCGSFEGYTDPARIPENTECIVSVGGDGTIIQAFRDTKVLNLPIIGFNFGTLGFLAEVEPGQLTESIRALKNDDYHIEERMLLNGAVMDKEGHSQSSFALNDIVVSRSGPLRVVSYNIMVNGLPFISIKADGIIVSTPTGSTGYNLSAGGPIVEPSAKLIVITPICAHSLKTRSVVLSPTDRVEIEAFTGAEASSWGIEVNFDGRRIIPSEPGTRISITGEKEGMKLIRISKDSFMEVLHKKMGD